MSDHKHRIVIDSITSHLPSPIHYTPESIGFKDVEATGKGVNICLLDSGLPDHKDIANFGGDVNFTNSSSSRDVIGHSSMMAGLMAAKSRNLVGVSPDATIYCAKIIDDEGDVRFDSFVAAILWAIIKEVHIIVVPMTTGFGSPALHDAIQKANDNNICVVCSSGVKGQISYPAIYDEVLSVGSLGADGKLSTFSQAGNINIIGSELTSTYMEQQYAVATGNSPPSALVAGMLARLIEKSDTDNLTYTPYILYETLKQTLIP